MVTEGAVRMFKYLGCAAAIMFAVSTQAYIVAAIGCAVLMADAFDH